MCGPRTGNHKDTLIRIQPYFVEWKAEHLFGRMEGFSGGEKDSWFNCSETMLNRRFNFVFKFKKNITYPGQTEIYWVSIKSLYNLKKLLKSEMMRYRNDVCFMLICIS